MVSTTNTTMTNTRHTVVGVFDGPNHAEQALNGLKSHGFTPEQVSVVAQDKQDVQQMAESTEMAGGGEGALKGAATGGLLGGMGGLLVGLAAMVVPGIGHIVGAGIIATTLAGAGIGAVAGGLVGALTHLGVNEDDAREYEGHVKQGSILLTAHADSAAQEQQAREVFNGGSGGSVRSYPVPQQ